jgi:hypothetical protein
MKQTIVQLYGGILLKKKLLWQLGWISQQPVLNGCKLYDSIYFIFVKKPKSQRDSNEEQTNGFYQLTVGREFDCERTIKGSYFHMMKQSWTHKYIHILKCMYTSKIKSTVTQSKNSTVRISIELLPSFEF